MTGIVLQRHALVKGNNKETGEVEWVRRELYQIHRKDTFKLMENDTYLGEFVAEANAQEFPIKDTLFISVPVGNGKTVFSDKRDYKLFKKSVNVQIYDRE